jgi:hypothetical protein
LVVVEVELFEVPEVFSSKELLDKELASGWNVYEPKVVVFGPQKDCFCRIVIDSMSRICRDPPQNALKRRSSGT